MIKSLPVYVEAG